MLTGASDTLDLLLEDAYLVVRFRILPRGRLNARARLLGPRAVAVANPPPSNPDPNPKPHPKPHPNPNPPPNSNPNPNQVANPPPSPRIVYVEQVKPTSLDASGTGPLGRLGLGRG